VIAFDLPGFGRSDKPARSYTPEFFQDVLLELMEILSISTATLVGHSLGAVIVHATALNSPSQVRRLFLVDGSLASRTQKLDLKTAAFIVPGLGEWMYNRLRKDPQAAFQSLTPYYSNLEGLPTEERAFLYQRVNERVWSDGQRRAFLSTLRNLARWLPGQQRGLPERLSKLTVPTLVLWGEQDRLQDPDNGRYLAEIQPSARLVVVPGAGHNLQQEQPQTIVEAILTNMA
jgi:pimeloyl-ACP methyl ester carboxylesterase